MFNDIKALIQSGIKAIGFVEFSPIGIAIFLRHGVHIIVLQNNHSAGAETFFLLFSCCQNYIIMYTRRSKLSICL